MVTITNLMFLDVSKAVAAGVESLNGGAGHFRGERAVLVRLVEMNHAVVTLPGSMDPDKEHYVPLDCLIDADGQPVNLNSED